MHNKYIIYIYYGLMYGKEIKLYQEKQITLITHCVTLIRTCDRTLVDIQPLLKPLLSLRT